MPSAQSAESPFVARPHRRGRALRSLGEGGFALLVTIVLVAFLVLILVGLASFTRVETQVASNNQQQTQARQNALLALNIALGQLQKHAGPDQRVTARADLEGGDTIPNARWTAVFGSAVAADYTQAPSAVATSLTSAPTVSPNTGSPSRLLNWLISGNERASFDPSAHIGAQGDIVESAANLRASIEFSPATPVSGLTAAATVETALTIEDRSGTARPAVLLVGPATVETALATGQALDYVAAPLVGIEVSADSVPGLSGSDPVNIGRYAWWVGDEGVKASANLPLITNDDDKPAAFATTARDAIELMDANSLSYSPTPPSLAAPRIDAAYNPAGNVNQALSGTQLTFASPAPTTLRPVLRRRYHDLTTHSLGVLADTYAGGLKRDLTALLDSTHSSVTGDPEADDAFLYVPAPPPGIHPEEQAGYAVPTWAHLRSHFQTVVPDDGFLLPTLPVHDKPAQPGNVGIAPVLTYAALGSRFAVNGDRINFNLYPLVVLWNPYTTPLRGADYEVGFLFSLEGRCIQFQVRDPNLPDTYDNWQVRETRDLAYGGLRLPDVNPPRRDRDGGGIERYIRFRVRVPDLLAGESRVFTLAADTTYGDSVTDLNPSPAFLMPGLNSLAHARMEGSTLPAEELGWQYRIVTSANYMKTVPGRYRFDGGKLASAADQAGIGGPGSGTTTNGAISVYLGAPRTTPPDPTLREQLWNPALNQWYQTIQAGYHQDNLVDNPLQGPEPLANAFADEEPSLRSFVINTQSGGGSNGTGLGNIPTQRWLIHGNPRAPSHFQTRRDATFATNHIGRVSTRSETWPTWFATDSPGDRASAGLGHDWHAGQPLAASLFEIRRATDALASIGQLQHANLSLAGSSPAYPVGNANAEFRIPDLSALFNSTSVGSTGRPGLSRAHSAYHDHSYLLNRALWDRYFFSTVPRSGYDPAIGLTHPRLRVFNANADLVDPSRAASHLLVEGAFNINSTSEQAWRAVLGGINQLSYDPVTGDFDTTLRVAFSRFLHPSGDSTVPGGGDSPANLWEGYRELSPEETAQLARNIVAEIRARGPFVSLADFVNRRLIDNPATPEDERIKGPLQAALDATQTTGGGAYAPNNTNGTLWSGLSRYVNPPSSGYNVNAARGTARTLAATDNAAFRRFAAGAPKFITQGDILSVIGSRLSARSDTFVIRSYGETVNPVTDEVTSRAWCEAVVQRLPDYVDPADASEVAPPASAINRQFGRRFVIQSFRWLAPSDI